MNVLGVIQRMTKRVGTATPSAVFSSADRTETELGAIANQVAEQIAAAHDWQRLRRLFTLTGSGTQESFALPYDYDRITYGTSLRDAQGALQNVIDPDVWLDWQFRDFAPTYGAWHLLGDRVYIVPTLADDAQVKFWYQSNRIVRSNGTLAGTSFPYNIPFELADSGEYGSAQTAFIADDDSFQLDWRLLELGMVWQWRASKGMPYAEDMQTFERELALRVKRERGPTEVLLAGAPYCDETSTVAYDRTLRPA